MHFLIIGDANADVVAPVTRFPTQGDDLPIEQLAWASGGSAANVATGMALLGMPARLLARVGNDPAARVALRGAERAGVDLSLVQRGETATGICYAVVSPGGERTFLSFRGANTELAIPANDALEGAAWLHVAGHALLSGSQQETTQALIEQAHGRKIPISLDLCLPLVRQQPRLVRALLPKLRVLFGNAPEADELGIVDGLPGGLAIVKRGAAGCEVRGDEVFHVPGFSAPALDTNGCGDAFVAAFLWSYSRGEQPAACARVANAAGALTSTRYGAAEALPTSAELHAFLATHR